VRKISKKELEAKDKSIKKEKQIDRYKRYKKLTKFDKLIRNSKSKSKKSALCIGSFVLTE